MEMTNCRPYIPSQLQSDNVPIYKSKMLKPTQSHSRDKHNKQRAAIHRLSKYKEESIFIYQNKELFVFELLKDNISIVDNLFKTKLNTLIEKYETTILSNQDCNSEKELDKICASLNLLCVKIEQVLSKDNFMYFVEKGYFINNDNVNIKNDPKYKELIDSIKEYNIRQEEHLNNIDNKVKKNISFAEMLKRNISTHHITND